jgi:cold shock CspA family protein
MDTIYSGKVKWFNMALGYGWIIEAETKKEYFCHHSGLNDHIIAGDKVQFKLIDTNKGETTINVIKLK